MSGTLGLYANIFYLPNVRHILYDTFIISIRYMYNNYKEYKLKWPRILIIGNMYTI